MKDNQLLIVALDVTLSVTLILIIAVIAITYDANKGTGTLDFVRIEKLEEVKGNLSTDTYADEFFAIILNDSQIGIGHVINNKIGPKIIISSLDEFRKEINALSNQNIPFVIYEDKKSKYFGNIVKVLLEKNLQFGIAKVKY